MRAVRLVAAGIATGAVTGWVLERARGSGWAVVLLVVVLAMLLTVLVAGSVKKGRTRRREAPRHADGAHPGDVDLGRDDGPVVPQARRGVSLLLFHAGFWPVFWVAGVDASAAVQAVLETAAAVLVALLVVRAHRRRQVSAARAAHPGATVVLASMVDLGSMRLAQWSTAAGASLPFVTGGVVVAADVDGLTLARAEAPSHPVHRWDRAEVELSSQAHPAAGAVLVLGLWGPRPALQDRLVPVERRRHDVTLAVRDATLTALTAATSAAVVGAAVASLSAQREADTQSPAAPPARARSTP